MIVATLQMSRYWLRDGLLLLCCVPFAYYVVATVATLRFFVRQRHKSLAAFTPPISVLKPVRGVDFASYENFRSFCLQHYPQYEILFCVNDSADPAVPLIRRLISEFPERSIRLLSDAPQLGTNRKVSNLALLAREAKYDLLAQSDGDVRVGVNYLREMAAPFADANTALVSCVFRGVAEPQFWAQIEALGTATDFAASVLMAEWLEGVTFALGASVVVRKTWLARMGGYEALANVLADDYEIGNRVARAGGLARVSREVVATMYPAVTFRGFWDHQSRWARTVRVCRPVSYAGLIVTHGLPWAIVGAVAAGSASGAFFFFAAYLVLRLALAWTVGVWGLRDDTARRKLWLVPLRDAVHFAVWLASFFSNRIYWAGTEFRIKPNGEMVANGTTQEDNERAADPLRSG